MFPLFPRNATAVNFNQEICRCLQGKTKETHKIVRYGNAGYIEIDISWREQCWIFASRKNIGASEFTQASHFTNARHEQRSLVERNREL